MTFLGDLLHRPSSLLFASLIIRLFQLIFLARTVFSLTINQPEQCFGLFFQQREWGRLGEESKHLCVGPWLLKSQPMLTFEGESVRSETDCAPSFIVSADFCKMYLRLIDCAPRAAAYSRAA